MDKPFRPILLGRWRMNLHRKGMVFPFLLIFWLMSQLILWGMLHLLQGQAQQMALLRQYYQAQIQWTMVEAQLAPYQAEQSQTFSQAIIEEEERWLDELAATWGERPQALASGCFSVLIKEGPYQGQLAYILFGLGLSEEQEQVLSDNRYQLEASLGEAALDEEKGTLIKDLSDRGFHLMGVAHQERQQDCSMKVNPPRHWIFNTGEVREVKVGHYGNVISEGDFHRIERLAWAQGSYQLIMEICYFSRP